MKPQPEDPARRLYISALLRTGKWSVRRIVRESGLDRRAIRALRHPDDERAWATGPEREKFDAWVQSDPSRVTPELLEAAERELEAGEYGADLPDVTPAEAHSARGSEGSLVRFSDPDPSQAPHAAFCRCGWEAEHANIDGLRAMIWDHQHACMSPHVQLRDPAAARAAEAAGFKSRGGYGLSSTHVLPASAPLLLPPEPTYCDPRAIMAALRKLPPPSPARPQGRPWWELVR